MVCLQRCGTLFDLFIAQKGVSFDNFIPNSAFCSTVEIMGAAQWVGTSSLDPPRLQTKMQVYDVDNVDRRCDEDKEELGLVFKIEILFPLTLYDRRWG